MTQLAQNVQKLIISPSENADHLGELYAASLVLVLFGGDLVRSSTECPALHLIVVKDPDSQSTDWP